MYFIPTNPYYYILFCILINCAFPGQTQVVTVYAHIWYWGNYEEVNISECTNLSRKLAGDVDSIKTNGNCVRLYDEKNCSGHRIELQPGSNNHYYLGFWNFNDRALSVGPCRDPIIPSSSTTTLAPSTTTQAPSTTQTPSTTQAPTTPLAPSTTAQTPTTEQSSTERSADDDSLLSTRTIVIISLVVGLIFVCLLLLLFFFVRKIWYSQPRAGPLSEEEIQKFLVGVGMKTDKQDVEENLPQNEEVNECLQEIPSENRPYNQAFEIDRSRIKFDGRLALGQGEFGEVHKGILQSTRDYKERQEEAKTIPVAIKTVKAGATAMHLRSLLKEVKVMIYLGKHEHIAEFIGCCTENLRQGKLLVVMEYCSNGNLEKYLRNNRSLFKNIVKKGRIFVEQNSSPETTLQDSNYFANVGDLNSSPQVAASFDYFQLRKWCIEVARGMEFLSQSKVIHSDLAARNVLLGDDLQAKISDFGLSRQLYRYQLYIKRNQEPLPWRWLAIESLKHLEFSTKSDVWSYGIFCWEIFTLGETPYQSMVWSESFISNLKDGLRPLKPKYATTECYNLMLRCWNENPTERPSFEEIIETLNESNQ